MRNFNYTARDKSGAMKLGSVQASDRNAALYELTAQGLVPLSVTEGVARSESLFFLPSSLVSKRLLLGFLLLTAIIAGIVMYAKNDNKNSQTTTRTPTKESSKPKTKVAFKGATKTNSNENISIASVVSTNHTALQMTNTQYQAGHSKTQQQEIIKAKIAKRPFKSGTEQLMSLVFNTQLGDNPIPVPKIGKSENIVEILNTDITLYDDDPEKVERAKTNVALAKQVLKEYVEKGGNVDDFIKYYREELFKIHLEWRDSQKEFITLLKAGDLTAADVYLKNQNKAFQERGIKPLNVPPQYKVE